MIGYSGGCPVCGYLLGKHAIGCAANRPREQQPDRAAESITSISFSAQTHAGLVQRVQRWLSDVADGANHKIIFYGRTRDELHEEIRRAAERLPREGSS